MDRDASEREKVVQVSLSVFSKQLNALLQIVKNAQKKAISEQNDFLQETIARKIQPNKKIVNYGELKERTRMLTVMMLTDSVKTHRMMLRLSIACEGLLWTVISLAKDMQKPRKEVKSMKSHMRKRYEPIMRQIDAAIKERRASEENQKIMKKIRGAIYV